MSIDANPAGAVVLGAHARAEPPAPPMLPVMPPALPPVMPPVLLPVVPPVLPPVGHAEGTVQVLVVAQRDCPAGQAQWLLTHAKPFEQAVPHAPQFSGLLVVSTHWPPEHVVRPAPQDAEQ